MRIFLTGGAGFIGSHLARLLLQGSAEAVTVFDKITYAGSQANLQDLESDPRFRFIHGDICEPTQVRDAMTGHDIVVHLAAETNVDRSLLDPGLFARTNCEGTSVVCEAAVREQVDLIVHMSTDEVYGPLLSGSFSESDGLAPRSPYSASKAGAEMIAMAHHHSFGLPVIVTRGTNVYGPGQHPEKFVPYFLSTVLSGERAAVYGDGLHVRDWIHVTDTCRAIETLLHRGSPGEAYNIGAGNEQTTLWVADALSRLLDYPDGAYEQVEDRPGNDRRYSVSSVKMRRLGWRPEMSLEMGLEQTAAWYGASQWWWEPRRVDVHHLRSRLGRPRQGALAASLRPAASTS